MLKLPPFPNKGQPAASLELGRVSVILGANGSGKSKTLARFTASLFGVDHLIRVEGGRAITMPAQITLSHQTFNTHSTAEKAADEHSRKQVDAKLTDRLWDALIAVTKAEDAMMIEHSRAVRSWQAGGRVGPDPEPGTPLLESLLAMFSAIFPSLNLTFARESQTFSCSKNGCEPYPISQLSDGEKQVFALLADVAILGPSKSMVVVDEPELNLNPALACRVWDVIEEALPESLFVYATHCLSFAMRPSVTTLYAIRCSPTASTFLPITGVRDLRRDELHSFLGAIPGVLSSERAVVVEGDDSSFDLPFYQWIVDKPGTAVIPLGDCGLVSAATKGIGVWESIAPLLCVVGVVDRDYRSDGETTALSSKCLHVLALHEAESCLAHPKLLADLAKALGTMASPPNQDALEAALREGWKDLMLRTAARRAFARCQINLRVSVEGSIWKTNPSKDAAVEAIRKVAAQEAQKVSSISEAAVIGVFEEEYDRCTKATGTMEILTLCPGKELMARLLPKVEIRHGGAVLNGARKHLKVAEYPHLASLRAALNTMLSK